ncbi:hypothetical protein EDB92DRAFT_1819201 [Lactarius akahatsu]|uniref:Uncharacterized protein n=1 Tax=Lactarius akahatsu TaxID=416441 RepID=A0AAD4L9Y7_9AGAM|nr:hypothetical protein EDB92DRAFT_1819201 [Lactarius akahatsu]
MTWIGLLTAFSMQWRPDYGHFRIHGRVRICDLWGGVGVGPSNLVEFACSRGNICLCGVLQGVNGAFELHADIVRRVVVSGDEADEARRYSLFSVTGKDWSVTVGNHSLTALTGSTFADPDRGRLTQMGSIHYGSLFFVAMLWAALPVLARVDVECGWADVRTRSSGDDNRVEVVKDTSWVESRVTLMT